ncbi:glycoside hydrolase family 2 protein [Serinibacter arcticus]|uniref:glycoside hydrolase family 2 protein n=1 Tax=Serinibacter arcticus TaxID=1655435 RepID=UPI0018EEBE14|nr:glycoside hydrolase family 2 protein [Serinibacter arcticus]
MTTFSLDGPWTARALAGEVPTDLEGRDVPAHVPGCIHLDLLAQGLIDEPFDGDNEAAQQWIGSTVWSFRRTFTWQPDGEDRHDLVALGLDTLATIELNGRVVATTANQNRSYRFGVDHLLREGENEIVVTFDAPVPAAERFERENGGPRFHVNHHPYNAIRKTASNFGWDWGIDVATSGIWRSIGIEGWSTVRIGAVRPLVDVAGTAGLLRAHVDLVDDGVPQPREVTVTVSRGGRRVASTTSTVLVEGVVTAVVPEVELWWPRGHGDQPLYDVEVEVGPARWSHEVGFRTVSLNMQPDEQGVPFELRVNGRTILIRGANWIPDDAFVTRIDAARLERRVKDATDANMNLLRIWGGGMYESDELYSICSREGVLVWQDFLLACAAYSEESWLASEIEAEAREAVARLSAHASLVLWAGNNENLVGFAEWGWRGSLEGRTWGDHYYRHLFPEIIAELDPARPYVPGSPFSSDAHVSPNLDTEGTVHIWDVWNEKDYTSYAEWTPRFVAEFGFQGPAAWSTLFDVVHDSPLHPDGHEMLVHQKAGAGNQKLERGLRGHFAPPRTIDEWHFVTQLNQAHALEFGIAYFRSLTPYNTGTVVWQLNDDWPVVSWAAVDFEERRKPLWYALRRVYAERFATIQPATDGAGSTLVLVNDTAEGYAGTARVERIAFDGEVLASHSLDVHVDARGAARVALPSDVVDPTDASRELVVVTFDGAAFDRVVHDLAEVVAQDLDPTALAVEAASTPTGAEITVTATAYVRDVVVLADRADRSASADVSLVSLLPGESLTVVLTGDGPIEAAAATDPRVVRSANQLHGAPIGEPLPAAAAPASAAGS